MDPGFYPGWQGGGIMESPTTWLGIFGVIIITILLIKKQTASFAIITGVVFVSVLSWFKDSEVSFFEVVLACFFVGEMPKFPVGLAGGT